MRIRRISRHFFTLTPPLSNSTQTRCPTRLRHFLRAEETRCVSFRSAKIYCSNSRHEGCYGLSIRSASTPGSAAEWFGNSPRHPVSASGQNQENDARPEIRDPFRILGVFKTHRRPQGSLDVRGITKRPAHLAAYERPSAKVNDVT